MVDHIIDASQPRGRVEIRTGVGRRRRWSDEEKGRIVAESYSPGTIVSEVARRHEMSSQHLFAWRKAARAGRLPLPVDADPMFVPILTTMPDMGMAARPMTSGLITIEVAGTVIRAEPGADLRWLVDVLRAVKAAT